jgi:hypothetical protein
MLSWIVLPSVASLKPFPGNGTCVVALSVELSVGGGAALITPMALFRDDDLDERSNENAGRQGSNKIKQGKAVDLLEALWMHGQDLGSLNREMREIIHTSASRTKAGNGGSR